MNTKTNARPTYNRRGGTRAGDTTEITGVPPSIDPLPKPKPKPKPKRKPRESVDARPWVGSAALNLINAADCELDDARVKLCAILSLHPWHVWGSPLSVDRVTSFLSASERLEATLAHFRRDLNREVRRLRKLRAKLA